MKPILVLFLDDEQNVLNSIRRIFEQEPYGVAVVQDPQQAFDIMAREPVKVVLSDQRMPSISGVEFLHRVKMQYPDVVRILFTAYADLSAAEQAINVSEVYRFINKPWHAEELKAAVVAAMYHYDLVVENKNLFETTRQKNEQLKNFSSTLSHELRTPLASIKAAIDIVLSGTAGPIHTEQADFLTRAKNNIDRLNRLINDILDLAYLESEKSHMNKQPNDMNKVIQAAVDAQEAVAKSKGLYVKAELDPSVPIFAFDADQITQILNNLISNAIKFTSQGGITVRSTGHIEHNNVEIQVRDTGCGIKTEDTTKLFEKFQQLGDFQQRCQGTGLGLAICKEIVRQHGGKIWMESTFGQGTCFYFCLPMQERRQPK